MTIHVVDKVVLSGGGGQPAPQPAPPDMLEQAKVAYLKNRGNHIIANAVRAHIVERHQDMVQSIVKLRSGR